MSNNEEEEPVERALEEQLQHETHLKTVCGLPTALVKAIFDSFDYACGLRDGRILYFSGASYEEGSLWVHLAIHNAHDSLPGWYGVNWPSFDRGVDIRLSEIVWVADAPFGS